MAAFCTVRAQTTSRPGRWGVHLVGAKSLWDHPSDCQTSLNWEHPSVNPGTSPHCTASPGCRLGCKSHWRISQASQSYGERQMPPGLLQLVGEISRASSSSCRPQAAANETPKPLALEACEFRHAVETTLQTTYTCAWERGIRSPVRCTLCMPGEWHGTNSFGLPFSSAYGCGTKGSLAAC